MKKTPVQRQHEIIKRARQGLNDSPNDLANLLGVSIMTAHRDLKKLNENGYLTKEHGFVTLNEQYPPSLAQDCKVQENTTAKTAIGQFVANNFINLDSDSIIIDSGTTTLALVNSLPDTQINVMVNSLYALNILATHQQTHVCALGGKLNDKTSAFEGSIAFDMLQNCHFTKAFLGAGGIDLKTGVTTANTANSHLTRLMAEQADKVYILTDLSKFNHRALTSVMPLDKITGIITEKGVANDYRRAFETHDIELFEVDVPNNK